MPTPKRPMIPLTLSAYPFVAVNSCRRIDVVATAERDCRGERGRHHD